MHSRFALVELTLRNGQLDETRRLLGELRRLQAPRGCCGATAPRRCGWPRRAPIAASSPTPASCLQGWPGNIPIGAACRSWPRADELDGRFDLAARDYERAVECGETQPAIVTRLLELLIARQEYLRAEEALGRYLQQRPLTPGLARLAAEVALGNGNHALAQARGERAVPPDARDYRDQLWRAHILHGCGEDVEATRLLRAALTGADHVPDVWVALVEQLGRTGQTAEAAKMLAEAGRKLPAASRALTLARAHEALHELADAEAEYKAALAEQRNDFIALSQAADFYLRQDRPDEAEPLLRQLLSPAVAAPAEHTVRARRQLAVVLAHRNRTEALDLLDSAGAGDERVRLYVLGQDPAALPQAVKRFDESLQHRPATPAERLLIAELCLAANKPAQARTVLQPLATQLDPSPQYVARYADVLIRTGDLDAAATYLAQLERWEPQSPRTRTLAAALRQAQQK